MTARFAVLPALAMLAGFAATAPAGARPLLPSDLPPDLREQAFGHDYAKVFKMSGEASWYGPQHHGRRTASGARFNQHALTAAHNSYPLGSRIRVVRNDTGRSVVVTVNDRMANNGRIIDLSLGAAERLGMLNSGVAQVTLVPLAPGEEEEVAMAPEPKANKK